MLSEWPPHSEKEGAVNATVGSCHGWPGDVLRLWVRSNVLYLKNYF